MSNGIYRFDVPDDWELATVEDISISVKSGSTPSRTMQSRYFDGGTTPWVKTMDLTNGYIRETDEKITELALKESSCPLLPPGTVLVAMYGGFNQIGRTGILAFEGTVNQAISAIIVDQERVIPEYLINWLNSQLLLWRRIAASSRKDPNITRQDVLRFPVLVPPLAEQRKIAAILSTWDEAIATVERLIDALQRRKRGLMQRLLTGEVRFPEFRDNPWRETTLGEIARINPRKPPNSDTTIDVSFVSMADVSEEGQLISSETRPYKEVSRGYTYFEDNDVLIAKITPCLENGKGALAKNLVNGIGFGSTEFIVVRAETKHVIPEYIYYHSITNVFRRKAEQHMVGSAGQKRVRPDFVSSYSLLLPSIAEQKKIVEVLACVDSQIALCIQYASNLNDQKRGLMQRLLTGEVRVQVDEREQWATSNASALEEVKRV